MASDTPEPAKLPGGPLDGCGTSAGVQAAVRDAGPLLPLRDVEQLQLIPGEVTENVRRAPRGRGRPAGAGNKRREEVRNYLLSRYAHPLEVLAQTYSRPADVLAAELGCKKIEAAALQIRCAVELAPYVEGKMPVAIDLTAKSDVVLVMTAPGQAAATAAAISEHGIEAVDWSEVNVEPVPAESPEFRAFSDASEDKSE
jgi:hypothetical protein